jgi:hypothetical protein
MDQMGCPGAAESLSGLPHIQYSTLPPVMPSWWDMSTSKRWIDKSQKTLEHEEEEAVPCLLRYIDYSWLYIYVIYIYNNHNHDHDDDDDDTLLDVDPLLPTTWHHPVPQFANFVLKLHAVDIPTSARIHWHCCSAALQPWWDPCDYVDASGFTWKNLVFLLKKAMSQYFHVCCLSQVSLGADIIQAAIGMENQWT